MTPDQSVAEEHIDEDLLHILEDELEDLYHQHPNLAWTFAAILMVAMLVVVGPACCYPLMRRRGDKKQE